MTQQSPAARAERRLLALNVGSTGLKAACYRLPDGAQGADTLPTEIERIAIAGENNALYAGNDGAYALLAGVAGGLASLHAAPDIVAHRIVHGGDRPCAEVLAADALDALAALAPLAPLHQPPALALVRATAQRWPQARQVAVFDTSWHQTMPETHRVFPLPYALYLRGVKRFGFHGLAFQSAMRQLATLAPDVAQRRVVLAHLGGGSSLSAVFNGRCVSTTMGLTPLDGLPMATRPGALDPGVLLHLQRGFGMAPAEIDQLLWHDCGMKGLSGEGGDMRTLLRSDAEGARRAVDVYVTRLAQGIAAMAACIGGIDALAFSGGIGAHAGAVRSRIADALAWMGVSIDRRLNDTDAQELSAPGSPVRAFALAVDEEFEIALDAVMTGGGLPIANAAQ